MSVFKRHMDYIRNFNHKEYFIERTKEYFSPLKEKWFWKYVFPVILVLSVYMVWLEHIG